VVQKLVLVKGMYEGEFILLFHTDLISFTCVICFDFLAVDAGQRIIDSLLWQIGAVIVSGKDGGGLPDRNAHIAVASRLGTINSNGVFRVTAHLGTINASETVCMARKGTLDSQTWQ
jgi:hypothetical protein